MPLYVIAYKAFSCRINGNLDSMKGLPISILGALLLGWAASVSGAGEADGVVISQTNGALQVEINGRLFTVYHYQDVPRPYFYPVLGPDELPLTRHWPMENSPGEEHDHPHHRGLWFAHGDVNGLDFWSEGTNYCKIVHEQFLEVLSGRDFGVIKSKDSWLSHDGAVVCTDIRTMRIYNRPASERMFDFDITLQAPPDKTVVFGDTKEGTMAVRVAETMRLKNRNRTATGHIILSTGARDEETWGKRADWCDYYGPVNVGTASPETLGIAIFDHPGNPRHPTTWHVRDYGLFAANPFGLHEFEKKPKRTGDMPIAAGQSITFRYRFYIHQGDVKQAKVAEHYQQYIGGKTAGH